MILTEEKAKAKLCQETFQPTGTADRIYHDQLNCIGSACMAWRWNRETLYQPDPSDPTHFTKLEWVGDYSTTHGYCGKAGRP